jgi:hypothetical protein
VFDENRFFAFRFWQKENASPCAFVRDAYDASAGALAQIICIA